MVFHDGFGAMTTRSLVRKSASRHGDRFSRLYNPAWCRLGKEEAEGAPGTYYWDANEPQNIYWTFLDQVLIGHDLLDQFPDDQFRILTSITGEDNVSLPLIRETNGHWKIEISDHLPILFDLELAAEANHA